MATVTIGTTTFQTYASIEEADAYMLGSINYAAWTALDDDTKARGLISATRALDALSGWDAYHDTFEKRLAEPAIVQASIELAYLVGTDQAGFLITGTTNEGIKRLKAGSVEQEFFAGASGGIDGEGYPFPLNIWSLISRFLGAGGNASGIGGTVATGTCGRDISQIDYGIVGYGDDGYRRSHP